MAEIERPCTCHPSDNPPIPCAKKFALSECQAHERLREFADIVWRHATENASYPSTVTRDALIARWAADCPAPQLGMRAEGEAPKLAPDAMRERGEIAHRMLQTFESTGDVWFKRAADALSAPAVGVTREAPAPDATVSEPVDWRWPRTEERYGREFSGGWAYEEDYDSIPTWVKYNGDDIEPLYTSPQHVGRDAPVSARDAVIEAINGYVHDQAADPPFTLEKYRAGILKAAIRSLTGAKP